MFRQRVEARATVPPRAVLGLIAHPNSRQESEVIVNPNMLRGRLRVRGDEDDEFFVTSGVTAGPRRHRP